MHLRSRSVIRFEPDSSRALAWRRRGRDFFATPPEHRRRKQRCTVSERSTTDVSTSRSGLRVAGTRLQAAHVGEVATTCAVRTADCTTASSRFGCAFAICETSRFSHRALTRDTHEASNAGAPRTVMTTWRSQPARHLSRERGHGNRRVSPRPLYFEVANRRHCTGSKRSGPTYLCVFFSCCQTGPVSTQPRRLSERLQYTRMWKWSSCGAESPG